MREITQEMLVEFGYTVVEKIIILSVIVISAHFIIKIINAILGRIFGMTKFDPTLEKFVHNTTIIVLWLVTFGGILIFLGVDVNAIVAGFGVGSFIIGFALKDTLNNFASGVMILFNHPFKIGDEVNVKGKRGIIKTISMSNIVLVTKDNEKVTLPNSIVWGGPITNFTAYKKD